MLNYSLLLKISKKTGIPIKKILDLAESGDKFGLSKNALIKLSKLNFNIPAPNKNKSEDPYERSKPKRQFDQFYSTIDTAIKRSALMNSQADIKNKRILFLGDDDFTSIPVSRYNLAERIVVLDIDSDILEKIKIIALKERLNLEIKKHDLRNKLPAELEKKFDVVFTDPPYTEEGVRLFISRAIQALDPKNLSARLYFCFGGSDLSKERYLPIYKIINDSGLMPRFIYDKFNKYYGAESIGNSSSLILCDTTPKTKSLIQGKFNGKIYTNN
jgi:hypothetical protein